MLTHTFKLTVFQTESNAARGLEPIADACAVRWDLKPRLAKCSLQDLFQQLPNRVIPFSRRHPGRKNALPVDVV